MLFINFHGICLPRKIQNIEYKSSFPNNTLSFQKKNILFIHEEVSLLLQSFSRFEIQQRNVQNSRSCINCHCNCWITITVHYATNTWFITQWEGCWIMYLCAVMFLDLYSYWRLIRLYHINTLSILLLIDIYATD